jgi:hypothetical protein
MSCCGEKRARALTPAAAKVEEPIKAVITPSRPAILFEYTGKTSLAVVGPVTRTTYRFLTPGAKVPVEAGDAGAIAAVPNLRRASSRNEVDGQA